MSIEKANKKHYLVKKINALITSVVLGVTSVLAASAVICTPKAYCVTSFELKKQREQLVEELAEANNELDQASDRYKSVLEEQHAAEELAHQASLTIKIKKREADQLQEKLSNRVASMYRNDETSVFMNLILGASTLSEMISGWNMINVINESDSNAIAQSKAIRSEIAMKQLEAEEAEGLARSKAEEAAIIKDDAETKAAELQKKIDAIDSSIKAKVQEEIAVAAGKAVLPDKSAIAGAAAGIPTNGDVVDYAVSRLGCPYVWGAEGPNRFDCSGLVMWCYAQTGKSLPHYSESQKAAAKAVIPVSEAEPGDVLWRPGHVGICVESGGQTYIHAPHTGDVVRVATGGRFSAALRF